MRPLQTSALIGTLIVLSAAALLLPTYKPLSKLSGDKTPPTPAYTPSRKEAQIEVPQINAAKENRSTLSGRFAELRLQTNDSQSVQMRNSKMQSSKMRNSIMRNSEHRADENKNKRQQRLVRSVLEYDGEEEGEEEKKDETNPRFQDQALMMLRDPATGEIPDGIGFREREFLRSLPSRNARARTQNKNTSELEASSLTWQARGPINIGGRTRTVAIDVSNENVIIAAGVGGGGIWRSTNKGQSWTRTTSSPQAPCVTVLAQDKRPGKQNIWYAGTGEFHSSGFPTGLQGILKSTDGGITWQSLAATAGQSAIRFLYSIVTQTNNSLQDEVIAATSGGIMRSVDGGSTWTNVLPTSSTFARTHVAISSTGVLYAVVSDANRKVYRSTNGVTWTDISPVGFQTTAQLNQRGILAVAPSNPNAVYMLFSQPGYGTGGMLFFKYTYFSGDGSGGGGTWEERTSSVMQVPGLVSGSYGGYCMLLNVHPQNENAVFLGSIQLYRSMDGFQTASQVVSNTGIHSDHHAIAFFSDGRAVAANDGGVYLSTASALQAGTVTWSSISSGYINSQFYHVALDEKTNGSVVVMGGMQDNGTYLAATGGISAWQGTGGGDGAVSAIANWGANKMVYSSYQGGKIAYRRILTNAGVLQTYSGSAIDPINATGQLFIHPYILDPNNDSVMYYPAGTSLWRHNAVPSIPATGYDGITGWAQFSGIAQGTLTTLSAAKGATTRLYLGTSSGKVYRIDNARTGTPAPIDVSVGKGFPAGFVQSIAIDPTNADRAIVVFSNYNIQSLFYTTDAGNVWQPIGGNLEQFPNGTGNGPACISAAIVNYQGQTTYFVGTSSGLYSTNLLNGASTTWTLENGVPPGVAVMHIAKRDIDGMVAVGTHGAGVYTTTLGIAPPVTTVSLTGFVRDNSSPAQPIQGVTVTLSNGLQAQTDASGAYTFNNLPKAVYSVTVTLPSGYYALTKTVLKDLSQQSGTQDFMLLPMQITGKVTLNAIGLANVSVSAGAGGTAITNSLGNYTISKVPAGSYTVTPTLAGYTFTPTTRTVTLSNSPNPPAPALYGVASAINFTATPISALTVSPQTISLAAAGLNNIALTVTGNVAWTASSNQAWATITPQSGTNNGTITLNVSANPNATQRTATITLSGGGITRTVSITQGAGTGTLAAPIATAASNIAGAGSLMNFTANWQAVAGATEYRIDISANSTFTLLVADNLLVSGLSYTALGWVLQPYYYRVRAVNATTTSPNSNVIVVTPPAVASLNVSPQTVTLTASQLTTSASITSNVAWTASSNQAWVTLQQTSGNGNGTLNFTISANTITNARMAVITISGGGVTKTITISQSGIAPTLTVTPTTLTASAAGLSNAPITVAANVAWAVSSSQAWATVSPQSGSNNGTFSLSVSANASTTQRTATVTISGAGISRTVTIVQAGAAVASILNTNIIQINPAAVPANNGAYPVIVTANVAWTASSNQAWVTVSPASGTGDTSVTIQIQTNTTTQQRTAVVTFVGGGITKTITVIQAGAAVASVLNTNISQINSSAVPIGNGAYTVAVTANVAWTASSNQAWVTVSPASGTGNANVTIQVQTNMTTQQRTAVVTFVGGGITKTVTVIQAGASSTLAAPTISFITAISATSFRINWQALTGAASYQTTIALDNMFTQGVINGSGTTTNYTAIGLTSSTTYYYRVRAVAADGTVGAWTNVLSYTTPPNAPTALALTNVSATSFTFNWTGVTNATRYDGEISANTSFSPLRAAFATSVGNPVATTFTMSITNPVLTPGATYYYRVKASVGLSSSAYSNVVSFTIPALVLTLKTSPNPSADVLRVEVEIPELRLRNESQEPLIVRLMDARGVMLQERTISGTASETSTEFDVHALRPGTYFVEVRSESGTLNLRRTEKFIKQ